MPRPWSHALVGRFAAVLLLLAALYVSGCSTLETAPQAGPYSGAKLAVSTFGTVWSCIVTHPLKPMNLIAVPGSILVAADIPLSTIADTILLPVTLKTDPSNRPPIESYSKGCADWEPAAQKAVIAPL
jgi:uncharacterized protein YceK